MSKVDDRILESLAAEGDSLATEVERLKAERAELANEVHSLAGLLIEATGKSVIVSDLASRHATIPVEADEHGE